MIFETVHNHFLYIYSSIEYRLFANLNKIDPVGSAQGPHNDNTHTAYVETYSFKALFFSGAGTLHRHNDRSPTLHAVSLASASSHQHDSQPQVPGSSVHGSERVHRHGRSHHLLLHDTGHPPSE